MKEIKQNSPHAWLLAARPKTLTGAIIPVMIGTSLAFADGQFKIVPALLCMLFACGMQIAANFINDLFDFLKGTDRTDRLGPERACAQGWITQGAMKVGIGVIVILSCISGLGLLYTSWGELPHGGWELIVLGVFCVIFAFLYTTVLSYQGWGDLLVLIFFGFVPVGGTYYVQAYTFTPNVIIASLISGLVIDTLLVVNNYRDRDQDALSGKTYAHRPFRRTFRQIPLPLARHHRDIAFLLVCPRLELCRYLHAFHLPLFPRNYLETHGKDTKR